MLSYISQREVTRIRAGRDTYTRGRKTVRRAPVRKRKKAQRNEARNKKAEKLRNPVVGEGRGVGETVNSNRTYTDKKEKYTKLEKMWHNTK